jgi:hypothetical protein
MKISCTDGGVLIVVLEFSIPYRYDVGIVSRRRLYTINFNFEPRCQDADVSFCIVHGSAVCGSKRKESIREGLINSSFRTKHGEDPEEWCMDAPLTDQRMESSTVYQPLMDTAPDRVRGDVRQYEEIGTDQGFLRHSGCHLLHGTEIISGTSCL